jgi:hypothetical protein
MRYVAHAVDQYGVALATYEFECIADQEAKRRGEKYLQIHPVIEIWQGVRRIGRLPRDERWLRSETSNSHAGFR